MVGELIDAGIDTAVEMGNAFSTFSNVTAVEGATPNDFKTGAATPPEFQVADGVVMWVGGSHDCVKTHVGGPCVGKGITG